MPAPDPLYRWAGEIRELGPRIAHVYLEVVKVSLIPSEEAFEGEGTEGDIDDGNPPCEEIPPDRPRFVSVVPKPPVLVDLLGLEDGANLAHLYGQFDQLPAGTYDKIRVRYRNVKVVLQDGGSFRFHPAGHHKFDIRFREGHELVIPAAATAAPPEGWLNYFRVKLTLAGIKIRIVRGGMFWKGCRVVLRPQIFAEADPPASGGTTGTTEPPPPKNLTGAADQVQIDSKVPPIAGRFNVLPAGGAAGVAVSFDDNTAWSWSDNVLSGSGRTVAVSKTGGVASLKNGAIVEIIAYPGADATVPAQEIRITFPAAVTGNVYQGWNVDNFFQLTAPAGYSVYPQPKRYSAYYDNAAAPHAVLTEAEIRDGVRVTARGYPASIGAGVQAYWISIGEAAAAGP
jgi:hypothetical protein